PAGLETGAALPVDWLETTYPSEAEVAALRKQAGELNAARRRLDEAEKVFVEWNRLKSQESAARQNVDRLAKELPAERGTVRGEHARLEAEEAGLAATLHAKREELDVAHKEHDRLTKELGSIEKQIAEFVGKLAAEEMRRQQCRQVLDRVVNELPAGWQEAANRAKMGELFRWQ